MRTKLIEAIAQKDQKVVEKMLTDVFGDISQPEFDYMLIILRACYVYDSMLTKLDDFFADNPRDTIKLSNMHSILIDNIEEQICGMRIYNLRSWENLKGTIEANSLKKRKNRHTEEIISDDFATDLEGQHEDSNVQT